MDFHTFLMTRAPRAMVAFTLPFLAPAVFAAGPVNINSADAQAIAQGLKGIGLKRAQAIVDYRAKHGPFRSADELAQVKGIGAKVIQKNRADIRLDARGGAVAAPAATAKALPPKR